MATLTIIYILAAFLCSWRMMTLFLQDELFSWLRAFRPTKFSPFRCVFCVTVWTGLISTAFFYFIPWLSFPLAFSQLVLILEPILHMITELGDKTRPKIVLRPDGKAVSMELIKTSPEQAYNVMKAFLSEASAKEKQGVKHGM